jgi:polyhydroxyalkanoate synthesis regulator phasin
MDDIYELRSATPSSGYHVGDELCNREVVMRGTIGETFERLILLQIGAAAATRDKVQEIVDGLVEQGRLERDEGKTLVDQVLGRARERSSGARSLVDATAQQGLKRAGLPTREDYEDLVFRVEQLEHRVRMLEDRPIEPPASVTPPPRAGGPEGVTGPEAPATGPDVAPQPPRDESDTPPGL